jgi:DNA invertase Pin-like site-specific DNA recombinase
MSERWKVSSPDSVEIKIDRNNDVVDGRVFGRASSAKDRRPALDRLMRDARGRRFDVVVVARFDRFARSVTHLLRALEEFSHLGVDFISVSEAIDTSTPMGKMIFTVLGAVAELERNLIKERVQMGINRARREGKALGRPRVEVDPLQVAGLRSRGYSWNQIAAKLGIGRGTAERAFKRLNLSACPMPQR